MTQPKSRKKRSAARARLTPAMERKLVKVARETREGAYAPYSQFHVGAAVLGASGRVYPGFNVENISYGLTVCAERTAVFSGLLAGEDRFVAVAVATDSPEPIYPCGACRQVLTEFSDDMIVLIAGRTGRPKRRKLSELLPHAFFKFPGARGRAGR